MSDDTSKAVSAWPMPAATGKCHVRVLVQDSRGLTSEVVLAEVDDLDTGVRVREAVRAALDGASPAAVAFWTEEAKAQGERVDELVAKLSRLGACPCTCAGPEKAKEGCGCPCHRANPRPPESR